MTAAILRRRPLPQPSAAEAATDAERQAITFLSYDLDVHLQPREHAMAVRARVLLRNDSGSPLHRLPLQISSTLQWTSVRIADAPATFSQQLVNSDIDHTGALREAVIPLAQPLAPQQSHRGRPYLRGNRGSFRDPVGADRHPGGGGGGLRLGPGRGRICGLAGLRQRGLVPGSLGPGGIGRRSQVFHRSSRGTATPKPGDGDHEGDGGVFWRSTQPGRAGWRDFDADSHFPALPPRCPES